MLLAFGLRVWRLDFQALWWDEGISVFLAHQDVPAILANRASDVHPPLYFLLLSGWVRLAGSSAWAARFLSVAAGTLCLPLLFQLGRRLANRSTGALAALILAASPFLVHHSQEVRMYALVPLLGLLSTYLMLRLLDEDDRLPWPTYLIVTAAALYTHYYAAFLPMLQTVLIFATRRRRLIMRWLAVQLVLLVAFLPWLAVVGSRLPDSIQGKVALESHVVLGPLAFLDRYLRIVSAGYHQGVPVATVAYAVSLILTGLGVYAWSRDGRRRSLALVLLYLGLPLLAGWAINLQLPFAGFPRLLAFVAPACYLLMAAGLDRLRGRAPALAAVALLPVLVGSGWGLAQHYTVPRQPEEDLRPLIARVGELAQSQDVVICDFTWQASYFYSYYRGELPRLYLPPAATWGADETRMARDLDRLMGQHRLAWYVAYQGLGGTQGRNIEDYLTRGYYLALDEWYGDTRLLLYAGPHAPQQPTRRLKARLGDHIQLTGYSLGREAVPAGDVLPLTLYWRATVQVAESYKVFVHLLDGAERVVAQRDTVPVGGARPTNTWQPGEDVADNYGVFIPPGTPPGEYRVEVGMYSPSTGVRLPVQVEGQPAGHRLLLGTVRLRAPGTD